MNRQAREVEWMMNRLRHFGFSEKFVAPLKPNGTYKLREKILLLIFPLVWKFRFHRAASGCSGVVHLDKDGTIPIASGGETVDMERTVDVGHRNVEDAG